MISSLIMKHTKIFWGLAIVVGGSMALLGGCGSDAVSSVTTNSSASSSSSSGDVGGAAGAGGMGGSGGMVATGGAGGMVATGGAGGMGGGAAACMKPGNTCGDCLFEQCQNAYCDCANEPECFLLIGCIQACPPNMPDCVSGCYLTHSKGFSEFTIASSCSGTLCAPSCPGSGQVKPCDLCLAQQCETQFETCLANTQCFPLIQCRQNCMGNTTCEQQCDTMYPQAAPLVQSLYSCAMMGCGNSCN